MRLVVDPVRGMEFDAPISRPEQRRPFLPPLIGLIGALALIAIYLGILSLLQSPAHAFGQLSQDWPWVGLVALGFGAQIGLYTYLRQIIQSMKLAGADASSRMVPVDSCVRDGASRAMTGAGTGASTVGMIACCAHHIADVAPLLALTGASGLAGLITFVGTFKIPIIVFGLLVNLVGIGLSLRTIRRERAHLQRMG
jgi:hypothetical protein